MYYNKWIVVEILLKQVICKKNYLFSFYGFCYKKNGSIRYLVIVAFVDFLSSDILEFWVIAVHLIVFGRIDFIIRLECYRFRRIWVSPGGSRTGDLLFLCVYLISPGWIFLLFLNIRDFYLLFKYIQCLLWFKRCNYCY